MKKFLFSCLFILVFAFAASAQTAPVPPPLTIKGKIDIKFNSRLTPGAKNVNDIYGIKVNVANSVSFQGAITDRPQIIEGWVSKSIVQPRAVSYDIDCDVINPRNPTQTKNVGRMYGSVGISQDGTYRYDEGQLVIDVLPAGNAGGFSSKFGGLAVGKPLGRPSNWMDTFSFNPVNVSRNVNGKTTTVTIKRYDKMEFRQCILAAGPVQIYQPVTVNGELFYDYDKACWFLNNITMQYADAGVLKIDRLSGVIRWEKKTNSYEFDVRVNEQPPKETAAFDTSAIADESSFFETNTTVPSLTGTMKYEDMVRGNVTAASMVTIDLTGNNITKQQLMSLCKLVIFAAVVPMNSD